MTAEPIDDVAAPWQPDPVRQAQASYTLEDLLNLPPDAPRVELVDGVIHLVPSASFQHQRTTPNGDAGPAPAGRLFHWLDVHAPDHLVAAESVDVALGVNSVRRPDVVLCHAEIGQRKHLFTPEQVVLVVEVVSPGTRRTDRFAKPGEYAAARIPYYWRAEQDPVHVYAYKLADRAGPTGRREYELVADSPDLLKLAEPFPIELAVADVAP